MNLKKHGINKRIEIDMKSSIKFPGLFLVLCILITGCMDSSFNKKININSIESDINGFYKKFLVLCQDLVQIKMRGSTG